MPVAWGNQRVACSELVAIRSLFDFYDTFLIQTLGKSPGKDFGHVLHNHHRRAAGGQRCEKDAQGLCSTGGSTDCDDPAGHLRDAWLAFARRDKISLRICALARSARQGSCLDLSLRCTPNRIQEGYGRFVQEITHADLG